MIPYKIIRPTVSPVPIVLSVPHCGTTFPDEIRDDYNPGMKASPDDTDWFVDQLYNFAPEMGITMITAEYSRWVIDLNRNPESQPLYNDGRIITGLCTTTDFHGNEIYRKNIPDHNEVERRKKRYYEPYYIRVQELLTELKNEFGQVLLWDAHSIRQHVPAIHKERFPDMILGSVDRTSASDNLIEAALGELGKGDYQLEHNTPFKGGQITRTFGKPEEGQHALQLEMNKILYMDDAENLFHHGRANQMRKLLKSTLTHLSSILSPQ